ncbi:MAG: hypothetical protein KIS87_14820 [Phycisphaeraceae bacterium]|nr:hypothetical protein [Phycisphaeraceae bacterium]
MASSFKGIDLFGSGPHRFALAAQGQLMLTRLELGDVSPGTIALGLGELDVVVRGRLVATSESALWMLRDAVVAQLQESPTPGTLVDWHGRSWPDMTFIDWREGDRTDRGRLRSVAYVAVFRRVGTS